MVYKEFKELIDFSVGNGTIELKDITSVIILDEDEVKTSTIVITDTFKLEQIVDILNKYVFIIYLDRYKNTFNRIII